jgi:hypothetical protein
MHRNVIFGVAALIWLCASAPTSAAPLTVGQTATTGLTETLGAGSTLLATQTVTGSATSSSGILIVSVTESVYFDGVSKGLDFLYKVSNTSPVVGGDIIEDVTASSFAVLSATTIHVGGSGSGTAPDEVHWSSNGSVVQWSFVTSGPIDPGGASQTLIIKTSAPNYIPGSFSVQDGGTVNLGGYQPTLQGTAVPEPSSLAIAGIGMLGMIGYGLRRRKALGA